MEQAVKQALESAGDPQAAEKAQEIVNNMDETDKQKAEEIIDRYADSDTISDVMEIVGDGVDSESLSEVQEYLQENVSEQDQADLEELYRKYSEAYWVMRDWKSGGAQDNVDKERESRKSSWWVSCFMFERGYKK